MSCFQGFRIPEQNWFKLPNEWTNITHDMTSLAEMKVVEYVLRHTWGFSEYNRSKHITLDEFENGRKKKDGSRIDRGTGLSQPSITDGVRRAVEHGYLEVQQTGDNGRIRKLFRLRILGKPPEGASKEDWEGPPRTLAGAPKKLGTDQGKTIGKKPEKNIRGTSESAPSVRKGFLSTEFDDKAAALLREVLVIHDSDLVAPPRGVRLATLSKSIKSLRLSGRTTATEHNILEVIKWLRKNYGDEHTPKMHKANDFADHWGRFRSAWIRDVGEESAVSAKSSSPEDREARVAKHELKKLVVDKIVEQQGRNAMFDFRDRDIRRALAALGEDPDTLTEKDWEL